MQSSIKTNTFRAFNNRNYRLFFYGQSVSQIGTWMQRTAVSWVVYSITHSAFMLGLTVFASQFPSFIFSLPGGIASDRYNRYKLLLITQISSMIQAVLLAILVLTNHQAVWQILTLSAILGVINAFDVPARQPLIHEMITDKADLPNAFALNSSMVNIARLAGPALSGIILLKFGAGVCFLINALSFVAVIVSLLMMKLSSYVPALVKKKAISELKDGFTYIKSTLSISTIMLMMASVSLLVLSYNTLLPIFAKNVFKGDADTFGYINSFIGLGAVAGSVFLASLKPGTDLKIVLLVNSVVFGLSLIAFSLVSYFPLAMLFAAISGFGMMSQTTIFMTIIQIESAAAMRGRVMSYVAMAYFGMLPLGSLFIGWVSQLIGAPYAILGQGVTAVVIAGAFYKFFVRDKLSKQNSQLVEKSDELVMEET